MWPDKYEDKRQGRQWHSDTQDPRAGAERLEAQDTATQTAGGGLHRHHHTWHLYCNMQTLDITTLHHIHNTVFRFSINLVTRKSVTCSLVWSWGCSLSWCFEVEIIFIRVKFTGECIFSWYICGPNQHNNGLVNTQIMAAERWRWILTLAIILDCRYLCNKAVWCVHSY